MINQKKNSEIVRKLIHYLSSLIPLIYYFYATKKTAIIIIAFCTALMLIAEMLRLFGPRCKKLYWKIFGWLTRSYEEKFITGATFLYISSLFVIIVFPKNIAVISLLFLTFGDSSACLVGSLIGRIKTIGNKTLEGSIAFFVFAIIATFWVPGIPFYIKIIGALSATFTEVFAIKKIEDNLTIPIVSGFVMYFFFNLL